MEEEYYLANMWFIYLIVAALYALIIFRYFLPIRKINRESVNVLGSMGKRRLEFMALWVLVFTVICLVYHFHKIKSGTFICLLILNLIPQFFIRKGILVINDTTLFIDGAVIERASIQKIIFCTVATKNGPVNMVNFYKLNGKINKKIVTRKVVDFLEEYFDKEYIEDMREMS